MSSANWVYFLLLFPLVAGLIHWVKNHEIVWWESLLSFAAAVAILLMVFGVESCTMSNDKEILSGRARQACHTPWWRAEWVEYVPPTYDDKGNQTGGGYYETHSREYHPEWWVETDIGQISLNKEGFDRIVADHGIYKQEGHRPDFDRGDRYDYFSDIQDDPKLPQYPVHKSYTWSNPLKGTDSIVIGDEVPEAEARALGLHEYPSADNPFISRRVIGAPVSTYRWDQMCALLGPQKKVNLTLINYGSKGLEVAVKQRDYWRNGRKNDLVLCYGEGWAYVFGWSGNELVKQELQSLLLEHPIDDTIVPEIDRIVRRDFTPYKWEQHGDTERPVSTWAVVIAFVLMAGTQVGLGYAFHENSIGKTTRRGYYV